eukprot:999930-Pyramimonas_sp.AAC.1
MPPLEYVGAGGVAPAPAAPQPSGQQAAADDYDDMPPLEYVGAGGVPATVPVAQYPVVQQGTVDEDDDDMPPL